MRACYVRAYLSCVSYGIHGSPSSRSLLGQERPVPRLSLRAPLRARVQVRSLCRRRGRSRDFALNDRAGQQISSS